MNTPYHIIVKVEEAYLNNKKLNSGAEVVVNTSIEKVEYLNRQAAVVGVPEGVVIEPGDIVVMHHNITRLSYDMQGDVAKSNYYLGDGLYRVPPEEIFMYKEPEGKWSALTPHCFVKPIKKEQEEVSGLITPEGYDSYKNQVKNTGTVAFCAEGLDFKGGDTIIFSEDSEYEFEIDGEVYYKMLEKDILAKVI